MGQQICRLLVVRNQLETKSSIFRLTVPFLGRFQRVGAVGRSHYIYKMVDHSNSRACVPLFLQKPIFESAPPTSHQNTQILGLVTRGMRKCKNSQILFKAFGLNPPGVISMDCVSLRPVKARQTRR